MDSGCGIGAFATDLHEHRLPAQASYRGVDLSPVMVVLAREKLGRFSKRVDIVLTDGSLDFAFFGVDTLLNSDIILVKALNH